MSMDSRKTTEGEVLARFGKQVQMRRKELGMTVYDLAERMGLSYGLIQGIEEGRVLLDTEWVFQLRHVLEIEVVEDTDNDPV